MASRVLVGVVPLGDAGVEVPAVVVELLAGGEGAHVVEALALEALEADDDVGDLDAGVVDVVLDLDGRAEEPQQAPDGVAEDRVAQVADVGGLVRVDRGVLDDGLGAIGAWPSSSAGRDGCAGRPRGRGTR